MNWACSIEFVFQMSLCTLALNREREELNFNFCRMRVVKVELPVSCSVVLVEVLECFIRTQRVWKVPVVVKKRFARVRVKGRTEVSIYACQGVFVSNGDLNISVSQEDVNLVRTNRINFNTNFNSLNIFACFVQIEKVVSAFSCRN